REKGEFVINLVSEEMAQAMNITAIGFEPGIRELEEAELQRLPSVQIRPPRIADSSVAMECELIVIDAAKHYIDTPKLNLIGRMHAGWYTRTKDLFRLAASPSPNGNVVRSTKLFQRIYAKRLGASSVTFSRADSSR